MLESHPGLKSQLVTPEKEDKTERHESANRIDRYWLQPRTAASPPQRQLPYIILGTQLYIRQSNQLRPRPKPDPASTENTSGSAFIA